jgi:uncharacterized protein (TIGR00251 family)
MQKQTLNIKVIPNARKSKVVLEENRCKVYVNVPPEDGKANQAVIALLADFLNVKQKNIAIIKGKHAREKVIEVYDL